MYFYASPTSPRKVEVRVKIDFSRIERLKTNHAFGFTAFATFSSSFAVAKFNLICNPGATLPRLQ